MNDNYYNINEQLVNMSADDAITLAGDYLDGNCNALNAEYLKKTMVAKENEPVSLALEYAQKGSSAAQFVYGNALLQGTDINQNISEGLFWLKRAHNNGSTKASIILASAYLNGGILKYDATKAVVYIDAAAMKGDPAAQFIYAQLYLSGQGVAVDEDAAIFWLQHSAQRGNERAQIYLNDAGIPYM